MEKQKFIRELGLQLSVESNSILTFVSKTLASFSAVDNPGCIPCMSHAKDTPSVL